MRFEMAKNQVIAIIMPAFNAQASIARAINSVIRQSYVDWQLYIIDDCSTDNTSKIVNNYLHDTRITLIKNNKNLGVASTRNIGILASHETIISFIDSDDEWFSDKLDVQMQELANCAGISASAYFLIDEHKRYLLSFKHDILTKEQFMKKEFRVCFSSILIKRGDNKQILFENIGHEDFLYLYEWLNLFKDIKVSKHPLVNYYVTSGSLSYDKIKACKWHYVLLKKITTLNKLKILKYMIFYMVNAFTLLVKKKLAK